MTFVQTNMFIPPEKISFFEECMGETVQSMWWDESGQVTLILAEKDRKLFLSRFAWFFSDNQLELPLLDFTPAVTKKWLEEDQNRLEPIQTERFFIHFPHYQGTIPPRLITLFVDSPQAFGSGHHETTKSCLFALQDLSKKATITNALDIGTGSGILCMAIATLWDTTVLATDCDAVAVSSALKNITTNGLSRIRVLNCAGLDHKEISAAAPFELIVANIHSEPLKELAPAISKSLSPGGKVILSGILTEQEGGVIAVYNDNGLYLTASYPQGQWSTFIMSYP